MGKEPTEFYAKISTFSFAPLLCLRGALSHRHTEELRRYIYRAARRSPWLIIDLRDLRMISRTAIGILMAAQRLQEERGGSIVLVMDKAPSTMIERILCLGELMPVVTNLEGAEAVTRSSIKAYIAREKAIEVLMAAVEKVPTYRPTVTLFNQYELN